MTSSAHWYGHSSLTKLAPLEAVLFEIDGTLCESYRVHYYVISKMLREIGYNGADTITARFVFDIIVGKKKHDIALSLFPDDLPRGLKFVDDEEALFREEAARWLMPREGLTRLSRWIERRELKRAAVTSASRANAELMLSRLGLSDFFDALIIDDECEHSKPHPQPYLKALEALKASKDHSFVFEATFPGIKAGVAAGMSVIGLDHYTPLNLLKEAKAVFVIRDYKDHKLWEALYELEKVQKNLSKCL